MIRTWTTFAVALGVLLGAWSLTHHTTPTKKLILDTPIYQKWGDRMARGKAPYRDVKIEYPPAALPTFVLPSLGHEHDLPAYERWFDREMAVCAVLTLLGVFLITRSVPALAITATAPIILGPVVLSRFDYWPTALAVLALAALLRSRVSVSAVLLGVAIAAKIWPAVLLPFMAVWLWRTRGRRSALGFTGGALAVLAAIVTPFAVLSPRGVWYSIHQQFARPLQIESLGASFLALIHHLFKTDLGVLSNYGSQNVGGWGVRLVGDVQSVVLLLSLAFVFVVFLRRDPSRERLLTSCAAAVTALVAFGKVFSPQYMVWLVPFVVLVPSVTASVLLVASLLLTQLYFPAHYWNYGKWFYFQETIEVVARNLVVVALFAVLAIRAARRARAPLPVPADEAVRARPAAAAHRVV